jgi:hypothetical protein
MCYKSPGPRCYSHGKEDYDKKEKAFVDATIIAVKTGEPEAMKKADTAKSELVKAEMDMYATKEGLGVLKDKLDKQFENKEITGNQRHDQYYEAKAVYKNKMDAYDKENKTVDGRKPSKEYHAEDQRGLALRINEYSVMLGEMKQNRNQQAGAAKLSGVIDRLQKRLEHARATKAHMTNGYLTPEDVDKAYEPVKVDTQAKASNPVPKKTKTPAKRVAKKPTPFYAAEPQRDEDGGWVGAHYDSSRTNQQVAALTRADLKKAVTTGALPKEYDYKVKNSGRRIEINVIGDHADHVDKYPASHGGLISRVTTDGLQFRDQVQKYANQYAYNKSQAQFDNFNQSHHIFVNFIDRDSGQNVRH